MIFQQVGRRHLGRIMKYKSGYKYVLAETYACKISLTGYFAKTDFIVLDANGNLVIKQNYAWDGATMFPDLEAVKRASLTHDALCQLVRLKLLPETILEKIHNVFRETIQEDIQTLQLTEDIYKYLPDILYNGLVFLGTFGKGFENPVKIAPDVLNRKPKKKEILKQMLDFRNYIY